MIRAAALILCGVLAACASAPPDDFDYDSCGVRPRAQIPLESVGNVPVMAVRVRGQEARFILDTGADSIVITEVARQRLGVEADVKRIMGGRGVGGETRSFAGKLTGMQLAGLAIPDHLVRVLPTSSGVGSHIPVDGLFGTSVLSAFEIDLDLPRHRVTLYAGHICPSTVAPAWTAEATVIEASRSRNGRFVIPVWLDGLELTALLDTGAGASVIAADVAAGLGATPAALEGARRAEIVGTGPGTSTAHVWRFRDIRVGAELLAGPRLLVAERPEPGVDMILGTDFLGARHLWLSWARKLVFVANR